MGINGRGIKKKEFFVIIFQKKGLPLWAALAVKKNFLQSLFVINFQGFHGDFICGF
jgi:hypothetical protein